ncbi:MAG: hypothetical protein AABY00_04265 [Nanoarchaeota archaeon]
MKEGSLKKALSMLAGITLASQSAQAQNQPSLELTQSNNKLSLQVKPKGKPMIVQQTSSLGMSWSNIYTNTPEEGTAFTLPLNTTNGASFYRLQEIANFAPSPSDAVLGPLTLEAILLNQVRANEPAWYQNEVSTTKYEIIRKEGKLFAKCTKRGQTFFERPITLAQAKAVRALYDPNSNLNVSVVNPQYNFNQSIQANNYDLLDTFNASLPANQKISSQTLTEGKAALKSAGANARSILMALDLLAKEGNMEGLHYALSAVHQLSKVGYFNGRVFIPDSLTITPAMFYQSFDSLKRRMEFPWSQNLSSEELSRIGTWRTQNEPLSLTRSLFYHSLKPLVENCKTKEEVFRTLNDFAFVISGWQLTPPTDASIPAQLAGFTGRCEEQTGLVQSMNYAFNNPVEAVSIPAWAKADGNHQFTALAKYDTKGNLVGYSTLNSADPAGREKLDQFQNCEAPKLYTSSPFEKEKDVTSLITITHPLAIDFNDLTRAPRAPKAHLMVYNSGMLQSVAQTPLSPSGYVFKNVGAKSDLLYIVGQDDGNGGLQTMTHPIILKENGDKRVLSSQPHLPGEASDFNFYRVTGQDIGTTLKQGFYRVTGWTKEGSFFPMGDVKTEREADGTYVLPQVHLAASGVLYHAFQSNPVGRPFTVEKEGEVYKVKRY